VARLVIAAVAALWLGAALAEDAPSADAFDMQQCARTRETQLRNVGPYPTAARLLADKAERDYDYCVSQAGRDAVHRAREREIRQVSADMARRKREEIRAELDRCMPRGDCNEEYLRSLSEEAVDHELDARGY
jgi:hypothetical protein